jgi:hypothetical protein
MTVTATPSPGDTAGEPPQAVRRGAAGRAGRTHLTHDARDPIPSVNTRRRSRDRGRHDLAVAATRMQERPACPASVALDRRRTGPFGDRLAVACARHERDECRSDSRRRRVRWRAPRRPRPRSASSQTGRRRPVHRMSRTTALGAWPCTVAALATQALDLKSARRSRKQPCGQNGGLPMTARRTTGAADRHPRPPNLPTLRTRPTWRPDKTDCSPTMNPTNGSDTPLFGRRPLSRVRGHLRKASTMTNAPVPRGAVSGMIRLARQCRPFPRQSGKMRSGS